MMIACDLKEFMKELDPWLNRKYIDKAMLDGQGHLLLNFKDGNKNLYNVQACSAKQLEETLAYLAKRDIPVEKKQAAA